MFANIQFNEFAGDSFYEVLGKIFRSIVPAEWMEAVEKYAVLFLILGLVIGISQCFFGYKLRKIWTGLDGMVVFGLGGAAVAVSFGLSIGTVVAVTVGASIAGGLLGYFLWGAGIFLRVFSVVSVCVFAVTTLYKLEALGLIIALAAGLIAAILTVAFVKIALIFYTSVTGALTAGVCLSKLFQEDAWYLPLIIGGILAVAGLAAQFITNRKRTEEAEESENEPFMPSAESMEGQTSNTTMPEMTYGAGNIAGMPNGVGTGNAGGAMPEMTYGAGNMAGMPNGAGTGNAGGAMPGMTYGAGNIAGAPNGTGTGNAGGAMPGMTYGAGNIAGAPNGVGTGNAGGAMPEMTYGAGNIAGAPNEIGTGNAGGAMPGMTYGAGNMAGMPNGAGNVNGVPAEAAAAMEAGAAVWPDLENGNGMPEIVRVCKNCGAEFSAKTKFCMKCGQRLI